MSCYVDPLMPCPTNAKWRYDKACHLIADSLDELHNLAAIIGLKRGWFQDKSLPHYDLTANKRNAAIKAGAIPLDRNEFVEKMRIVRKGRKI